MADAPPSLEFFYDCSSPWTYFAFTRIIPMAEALNVPARWRPHLVGGVFNAVNQEIYAARQKMFDGDNARRPLFYQPAERSLHSHAMAGRRMGSRAGGKRAVAALGDGAYAVGVTPL